MHALQPMQIALSKSTMPSARRYIASVGQAVTHGASVALVAARHLERAARLRERAHVDGLHVRAGDTERHLVLDLHAVVHAWQPMQRVWSSTFSHRAGRSATCSI